MKARTWPYGTRKKVRIVEVRHARRGPVIIAVDQVTSEGFVLCGIGHMEHIKNDVTIEFRKGGPTGGYWDIVEEADE